MRVYLRRRVSTSHNTPSVGEVELNDPGDVLARFLLQKSHFKRSENRPTPEAFIPGAIRLGHVESLDLNALLNAVEKEAIQEALRRCNGNQSQAARLLGTSRYTLLRRMAQYQMRDAEPIAPAGPPGTPRSPG